jgi:protein SCO1/2
MTSIRIAALAAAAMILLFVATAWLAVSGRDGTAVWSSGEAAVGGPFTLVDTRGERVTEADLAGRPYVLFFGFTYCPDVCPTTLAELTLLIDQLGPAADRLDYLFVTVDPERDTQAVMARYLESFSPRIAGLTGTEDEVAATVAAYRATRARVPLGDGQYTMDHTAAMYLMDADGGFAGTISPSESHEVALQKLRRLAG